MLPSLLISILLATNTTFASITFPAKEIKVTPVESNIETSNLRAKLTYTCQYLVGPSRFDTKECVPPTVLNIRANQAGIFKFPALTRFYGAHTESIDNYEIEIRFYDGDNEIATISARGEKSINDLSRENLNIKVLKLGYFLLDIRIDDQQIADTHRAALDTASISVYTKLHRTDTHQYGTDSFMFFDGHLMATVQNSKLKNYYPLKDMRTIGIAASYLSYIEDIMPKTSLEVSYRNMRADGLAREDRKAEVEFPATSTGPEQIKRIDLK